MRYNIVVIVRNTRVLYLIASLHNPFMKFEFSAGGVVFRKNPMGNLEVLLGQHGQHKGWVFPKGLIGDHVKGEGKEATAVREVEEETGVVGKIVQELLPTTYWYQWEGERIKKTVYYYLMQFVEDTGKRDEEMAQVKWVDIDVVADILTYPSDKAVWQQARPLIVKQ